MEICADNKILARFATLLKNNRLAHAYLFIGPKDAGKIEAAKDVAKFINCEDALKGDKGIFCGQCASCIKIDSGNHPDIFIIDITEGESIRIEQIRDLVAQSQLKPFEAFKKVFIIKNAENLTTESSNALLKTLEEPTKSSLLILTTSVPEKCLDTVKSRCHAIPFFPVSKDFISGRLEETSDINSVDSRILANFSEGCLQKAMRLKEKDFLVMKNEIINEIVFNRDNDGYIDKLIPNKESIKEMLNILLFWFRDLILLKSGIEEFQLVNADRKKELFFLSDRYSFAQLDDIIKQIIETLKLSGANLNVKIPLELLKEKIWVR